MSGVNCLTRSALLRFFLDVQHLWWQSSTLSKICNAGVTEAAPYIEVEQERRNPLHLQTEASLGCRAIIQSALVACLFVQHVMWVGLSALVDIGVPPETVAVLRRHGCDIVSSDAMARSTTLPRFSFAVVNDGVESIDELPYRCRIAGRGVPVYNCAWVRRRCDQADHNAAVPRPEVSHREDDEDSTGWMQSTRQHDTAQPGPRSAEDGAIGASPRCIWNPLFMVGHTVVSFSEGDFSAGAEPAAANRVLCLRSHVRDNLRDVVRFFGGQYGEWPLAAVMMRSSCDDVKLPDDAPLRAPKSPSSGMASLRNPLPKTLLVVPTEAEFLSKEATQHGSLATNSVDCGLWRWSQSGAIGRGGATVVSLQWLQRCVDYGRFLPLPPDSCPSVSGTASPLPAVKEGMPPGRSTQVRREVTPGPPMVATSLDESPQRLRGDGSPVTRLSTLFKAERTEEGSRLPTPIAARGGIDSVGSTKRPTTRSQSWQAHSAAAATTTTANDSSSVAHVTSMQLCYDDQLMMDNADIIRGARRKPRGAAQARRRAKRAAVSGVKILPPSAKSR